MHPEDPQPETSSMEGTYDDGSPDQNLGYLGGLVIDPFRFEVTLTPLDSFPPSDVRTLRLHKGNRSIDVGRASRNPKRDHQPSSDNAAFRCPIMSRQHARFTVSPVQKLLFVEDQGSTHGTYVRGRKITAHTKTVLNSGDLITFGTTVANGPSVFTGKKLRVEYKWQPRYNEETSPTNKNRAFTVPESENEEEETAAYSREPSVEVTKSNVISTRYSVPSESEAESVGDDSEDDCAELPSVPHTPQSKTKESPITSPEELTSKAVTDDIVFLSGIPPIPKLRLELSPPKSPNEGSSRQNPIDLDEAKKSYGLDQVRYMKSFLLQGVSRKTLPKSSTGIENEGRLGEEVEEEVDEDEEGPEVLSSRKDFTRNVTKRSDIAGIFNDKPAVQSETELVEESAAGPQCSASNNPVKTDIKEIVRETQTCVARDLYTGSEDDQMIESEVEEGFQAEEEVDQEDFNEEKDEEDEAEQEDIELEEDIEGAGDEDRDDSDEEDHHDHDKEYEDEDENDGLKKQMAEDVLDGQENNQDDMDDDFLIDFDEADGLEAVLSVENAGSFKPNAGSNVFTPHHSRMIEPDMPHPPRHSVRSPSPSDAALARNPKSLGSSQTIGNHSYHHISEKTSTINKSPVEWYQSDPIDWNNLKSPSCKGHDYTSGPFSLQAATDFAPSPDRPTEAAKRNAQHQEEEDLGFTTSKSAGKPPMSIAFALNSIDKARTAALRKTATEDQSSKLHISNLVNSQHAEPVGSRKRKATEISVDDEFDTPYFHHAMMGQDTPLPDAQPRDQPILTETLTALDETAESSMSSITTTTVVTAKTSQVQEPAHKKAKTSSRASGVGKFLLGVGVGAVGFAAAFLATIPASVQEEALLGL